jgi:hypothetical protein
MAEIALTENGDRQPFLLDRKWCVFNAALARKRCQSPIFAGTVTFTTGR